MSLRTHGDTLVRPGSLDFAVNVWPGERPAHLDRALSDALASAGYPDGRTAREAVAARHGCARGEVLLLNGACEAFWLLAQALRPRVAACVHPGFTEPEAALAAAGTEVRRVFREPVSWRLDPVLVPAGAELVVIGNPDNPTGTLEIPATLDRLRRPGRLLVVDESFMDFVPDEVASLAGTREQDVVVVRSLTKLWSLAGIRAGYLLAAPDLVRRLESQRQPWSVNALACAALDTCSRDRATPARIAREVTAERTLLAGRLTALSVIEQVWPSAANFLLLKVANGPRLVDDLAEHGISVRPAASFPGLGNDHIRVAVRSRDDNERLLAALDSIGARWD